ncbi:prephenate dehydrogenase/arogenate dehydrogenase family protein [Nocardioides litoris]|uniref:prephenate dehydrogenase/arogenate dehydrogenase family protein n=1 Tax=Nocardioides litoris TaxID=1926648 RepID=UPI0011235B9B
MSGPERVAVVGAGLIGGSVVRRLAALGRPATVVDPRVEGAAGRVPADADLVVVAVPLAAMPSVLARVADEAPAAVVVDLGSVKGTVAAQAAAAGLEGRWVGAHPMAGSEHSGFEHSTADLLLGATWAVTRGPGPVADVVRWIIATFEATVLVLDAAEHDRSVALVSHAPHVLANALLETVGTAVVGGGPAAALLAAGSFRDGTRVAGRDPERTRAMLADNSAALGPVLDDLVALLQDYRRDLADPDALAARLAAVTARADAVRRPRPAWAPCPDLDAVLADPAGPVLVRSGADGLESAPAG